MKKRLFLSPPHMSGLEESLVAEAIHSNWIAPLGPMVDHFEREMCEYVGIDHAVALSSGTAALHLALVILGTGRGDEVICSDLTFSASANAIVYAGAKPVFVDCDRETWNMNPDLLENALEESRAVNRMPKAVMAVDLYGQCADYPRIEELCLKYDVPLIEDAAEALGATCQGKKAGCFGKAGVFSFNGNKIITTSGGGMLVSEDGDIARKARYLATQARDPAPHYEHSTIGYNYRMSNILAAIGRGQLRVIEERVAARRGNFDLYREALGPMRGIEFMPEASYGRSNRWLTCIMIEPDEFGATREDIRLALEAENIEARPVWKPMHMQPVFSGCPIYGGETAAEFFEKGLCLPSGSNLTMDDIHRVVGIIRHLGKKK